ncbi:MAG TPA: acyl-CoA thioesterase II [Xanthobacteraceae bacterium]|nr:acyl-CoA thioesterase II [Xanthobacteraceae bacterium]
MSSAISEVLAILDLEPLEVNLFRGRSPQVGWQRVFGGQVIGQALVAACRTVEGRPPHSLHAYFLLPGDPAVPIIYDVDRIRDGKSFTTRRVRAIQHGQAIFSMSASFHADESGLSHQARMPDVPAPDALPSETDLKNSVLASMPDPVRRYYEHERPIELRPVEFGRYLGQKMEEARFHIWIRATGTLPDDPAIHQCVLAYASDLTLLDAALVPHGRSVFDKRIMAASLDHALWFHRPFRADDWLLYAQDSPNLSGARGYARGLIFARDGTLVASVAQEGLLRERKTSG